MINDPTSLSSLEKHRLRNLSIKSKFTSSTNSDQTSSANQNNTSLCSSTAAPQYAEIYAPPSLQQQLQQQHHTMANPYASTGLFVNQISENANNGQMNVNVKYSSYTIKMLNDNKTIAVNNQNGDFSNIDHIINNGGPSMSISEQKKLLKYLQATQSQTNTPRIQVTFFKHEFSFL